MRLPGWKLSELLWPQVLAFSIVAAQPFPSACNRVGITCLFNRLFSVTLSFQGYNNLVLKCMYVIFMSQYLVMKDKSKIKERDQLVTNRSATFFFFFLKGSE